MRPEPLGRVLEVAAPCGRREALLCLWVCSTVGSSTTLHPHGVTGLRFIPRHWLCAETTQLILPVTLEGGKKILVCRFCWQ